MAETDVNTGLRDSPWDGFIGVIIKAKDTEEHQMVHDAFREFCKIETKNDYTQGLKILLQNIETDYKYELLYEEISRLKADFEAIKATVQKTGRVVILHEDTLFGGIGGEIPVLMLAQKGLVYLSFHNEPPERPNIQTNAQKKNSSLSEPFIRYIGNYLIISLQ